MSEGRYVIDDLEITANPANQTPFEKGMVRGAKWAVRTILKILDDTKHDMTKSDNNAINQCESQN